MLKYSDFALSNTVEEILREDLWVFTGYNAVMFRLTKEPVKFSASASVFFRRGRCRIQISLRQIDVEAPAIISIREGEILQLNECSDDIDASFCVMSKEFTDTLFAMTNDLPALSSIDRSTVVTLSPDIIPEYDALYSNLKSLVKDQTIGKRFRCLIHTVLAFYYKTGYKMFELNSESRGDSGVRLTESFMILVQRHFREERFLEFYATSLGITAKHLSRVVKAQTGMSPVDWIERYVILEAKVLLRSSTMTIQQIADHLHFSSQSFFGKHFKKHTGRTPGEFRNE